MPYSIDSINDAAIAGNFDSFQSMLNCTPNADLQVIYPESWQKVAELDTQENQQQQSEMSEFDLAFMQAHPEACIRVVHRDYPEEDDRELLFVTESVLQKWLETQRWWSWHEYCQGYGDGGLSHLNIRVFYPDGREEVIDA